MAVQYPVIISRDNATWDLGTAEKILLDGSLVYFLIHVSGNTRSSNTAILTKINGQKGNLEIPILPFVTGTFLTIDQSDVVVRNDEFNYSVTTGSGGGSLTIRNLSVSFIPDGARQVQKEVPLSDETARIADKLIDSLDDLNKLAKMKLGCYIFTNNAKLLKNLKQTSEDEKGFVYRIATIAVIIDDIDYDEINQQISVPAKYGSINLIEALFLQKGVVYNERAFNTLRKLHQLRNKKAPIHNADHEAIPIMQELGISYPINDWNDAGKKCLSHFFESIELLGKALLKT
jgi:hypothetical protein